MDNTNDKNFKDLKDGAIATEVKNQDAKTFDLDKKPQPAANQNLIERIEQLTRERVTKFQERQRLIESMAAQQEEAKKKTEEQYEQVESEKQKQEKKQELEQQQEPEQQGELPSYNLQPAQSVRTEIELNEERENQDETDEKSQAKQKAKRAKFGIKYISVSVCIAIALFCGLAIHNAVKIAKLSSEVSTSSSQIEVNTAKYIYKISQIDDLVEDGKNAPVDSFEIGADRYLESYPEEIQDVSEIEQSSNWFDRFVNKIRKFFGRA